MPREFVDLDIEEVSAVDHPANKRTWLVIKRAEKQAQTTDDILTQQDAMRQWWGLWEAFQESVHSIMMDDEVDRPAMLRQTVDEFAERARIILPQLVDDEAMAKAVQGHLDTLGAIAKAKRFASQRWAQAWKMAGAVVAQLPQPEEAAMPTLEQLLSKADQEIRDAYAAQVTKIAELEMALAKTKEPDEPEDIWKGVNPAIKVQMEALQKRTEDAEKAAAFEKSERVKKECMAEAASFSHLALSPDDHWPIFKALRDLPDDMGAKVIQVLRSANEIARQGKLMQPRGTSGPVEGAVSVWGRIESLAKAVVEAEPSLTMAQAIAKVCEGNPDLYTQYLEEQ